MSLNAQAEKQNPNTDTSPPMASVSHGDVLSVPNTNQSIRDVAKSEIIIGCVKGLRAEIKENKRKSLPLPEISQYCLCRAEQVLDTAQESDLEKYILKNYQTDQHHKNIEIKNENKIDENINKNCHLAD